MYLEENDFRFDIIEQYINETGPYWSELKAVGDYVRDMGRQPATVKIKLNKYVGMDSINQTRHNFFYGTLLKSKLFKVMEIMRFSNIMLHGFSPDMKAEEWFDFGNLYPFTENGIQRVLVKSRQTEALMRLESIRDCDSNLLQFGSNVANCFEHFDHVLTDRGVCSSLNSQGLLSKWKSNAYVQYFKKTFHASLLEEPFLGSGSGKEYSFNLLLDVHSVEIAGTESGHFVVSIGDFYNAQDTRVGFPVIPGQQSTIGVRLNAYVLDDVLQDSKTPQERECRFSTEKVKNQISLFQNYSQKGCEFECRFGAAVEQIGCIPWNYVHPDDLKDVPICTRDQVSYFQEIMLGTNETCLCLKDCNGFLIETQLDTMTIDPKSLCLDPKIMQLSLAG